MHSTPAKMFSNFTFFDFAFILNILDSSVNLQCK